MKVVTDNNKITIEFENEKINLNDPKLQQELHEAILSFCKGVYTPKQKREECSDLIMIFI